jgi:serine/threonine protein kinase
MWYGIEVSGSTVQAALLPFFDIVLYPVDIKPANVMVTKGSRPGHDVEYVLKLGDFGCAIARQHIWQDEKRKHNKNSFMTNGWTPPEEPAYVARSDVWQASSLIPQTFMHC